MDKIKVTIERVAGNRWSFRIKVDKEMYASGSGPSYPIIMNEVHQYLMALYAEAQ